MNKEMDKKVPPCWFPAPPSGSSREARRWQGLIPKKDDRAPGVSSPPTNPCRSDHALRGG